MLEENKILPKFTHDNLIKNFYMFGVEPEDIILSELSKNCFKEDILPIKLLSIFPPTEMKTLIDPNIIISHCFPNGFSLKQSVDFEPIESEYFYFSLKNLLSTSYNDKRIYFTCCIFYENLGKYLYLKEQILEIKNDNSQIKNIVIEKICVPKLICISSFIPYPLQYRTILEKLILYVKKIPLKSL